MLRAIDDQQPSIAPANLQVDLACNSINRGKIYVDPIKLNGRRLFIVVVQPVQQDRRSVGFIHRG